MAIANRTELIATAAATLDRNDLTDRWSDFIALTEADLNRELRVRQMLVRASATITDEYSTVPTDFLGVRWLRLDGKPLAFVDQADLADMDQPAGRPIMYSIVGGEVHYYPPPAGTYTAEMAYWARIPALTVASPTNWLLTTHPDAYYYGVLLQAGVYLRDADMAGIGGQGFQAALAKIKNDDELQTFGDRRRLKRRSFN